MGTPISHPATPKRLTAVWSRDVDPSRLAGRPQMIQSIRRKMSESTRVNHKRLTNVLETRSIRTILGSVLTAARSLLSGRPPSLQCLLYCDRANHNQILEELRANPPEIVYCDGVRTHYFLERLGKLRGKFKLVVDFDDLMSRRMQSLATADTPISLGYLQRIMPSWLLRALALGFISKAIARYEHNALIRVENEIGRSADIVVMISRVEGDSLAERYRSLGCKAKVHVIPPPVEIHAPPQKYEAFTRFIFIGTDTLPQNKLTIQLILDLWRSVQPQTEIHIFGHMASEWPSVPGVIFEGYAPSLEQVYLNGAVLFAPGVLRGGLKTKVAEAFAHGCAVIGNDITLEGMSLPDYPLLLDSEKDLAAIVQNPWLHLTRMREAACSGQEYVRLHLSREHFERKWDEVLA